MRKSWSAPTSRDEVRRRAGGRSHYNSWRRCIAEVRRQKVFELLSRAGCFTHGSRARIARALGVSEATISRDVAKILPLARVCPECGYLLPRDSAEDE